MLTFISRNLSEDCTKVVPGGEVKIAGMDAVTAIACLRAFAGQTPLELVNSEARIYLANSEVRLSVQSENGRLFSSRMPVATHVAVEQTPEEIIELLDGVPPLSYQAPSDQDPAPVLVPARRGKWRDRLNTGWLAGGLAVVIAVMLYFNFAPETPDGIKMISDSARIAGLHTQFNGRYGQTLVAGATGLLVENGRFVVYHPTDDKGTLGEPVLNLTYRYGLRGAQIVLVVANGAVLGAEPGGDLRFNDTVYPRVTTP